MSQIDSEPNRNTGRDEMSPNRTNLKRRDVSSSSLVGPTGSDRIRPGNTGAWGLAVRGRVTWVQGVRSVAAPGQLFELQQGQGHDLRRITAVETQKAVWG